MAKVTGPHQSPRAPSMRGAFLLRPHGRGFVAQAWPTPRPGKKSERQQVAIETFKEAAWVAKFAPAEDQMTARRLSHGSQFLPRDLQYMAIYGRLCTLFFTNGERRYQLASRNDLSELLDIFGFQPGALLYRGDDYWQALAPPQDDALLAIVNGKVQWVAASDYGGGGGGFSTATMWGTSQTVAGVGYMKGNLYVAEQPVEITRLHAVYQRASLAPQTFAVIVPLTSEADGFLVNGPIARSLSRPISTNQKTNQTFDFEDPVTLFPGVNYLLGIATEPTNPVQSPGVQYSFGGNGDMTAAAPMVAQFRTLVYADANPAIGTGPAVTYSARTLVWPEGYPVPSEE